MATVVTVDSFARDVLQGAHLFQSHTFKIALSNTSIASSVTQLSGITELSAGSGYSAGGNASAVTLSDPSTGVCAATFADTTFTASGGVIGPFRYGLIYNDTHASDRAVAVVDFGTAITLVDGASFVADFSGQSITVG